MAEVSDERDPRLWVLGILASILWIPLALCGYVVAWWVKRYRPEWVAEFDAIRFPTPDEDLREVE